MSDSEKNKDGKLQADQTVTKVGAGAGSHSGKAKDAEPDDLEFISEETARDKSKMADGVPEDEEAAKNKRTLRRRLDSFELRKEKYLAFVKKHSIKIGIGAVVVIVVISIAGVSLHRYFENKEKEAQARIANQQKEPNTADQAITKLITQYYGDYADGNTTDISKIAYPMSDAEKAYITVYGNFIDTYENIECYLQKGEDDKSYIVSVEESIKFKGVKTAAPALDFFYVRENSSGTWYIDNTYSRFNLEYQENKLDSDVVELINNYESGEDVVAMQSNVQAQYDKVLSSDKDLKNMIENTLPKALASWQKKYSSALQAAKNTSATESKTDTSTANPAKNTTKETTVTRNRWVYTKDEIVIRKSANANAKVVASASKGADLYQLKELSNGWSKIKTGKITGYVKTSYITTKKPK